MSHTSSNDSFTPSTRPSHLNAHVSPLNALSNQPARPYVNLSSNSSSILSNKLIPRDYLTPRSKPPLEANVPNFRNSPLVSRPSVYESESATNIPSDVGSARDGDTRANTAREEGGVVSDEDHSEAAEDIRVDRTKSPESVVTTVSLGSSPFGSNTTIGVSSGTLHNMPRTSSIDSAISSVSASSQQRKEQGDAREPSPSSVRSLIATAGSAEKLVLHLLKEKSHAANQNSQLWKLVEKQRALLIGLNKDLERITKDRDKYKKKAKELHSQMATQSHSQGLSAQYSENAVQPPEVPPNDYVTRQSTVDSTPDKASSPINVQGPPVDLGRDPLSQAQTSSIQPALQTQTAGLAQPSLALTDATPINDKPSKGFSASRKAAPKPLNLMQKNNDLAPQSLASVSEDVPLVGELDESRGRRKTREEDDRDREKSLIKDQEARSKSKKQSRPPAESEVQTALAPPIVVALPASPRPQGLVPGSALNATQSSIHERTLPMPLKSPGLPASPRPMNSNYGALAALPMSPRAPPPGPLSPRAPKQPIPPPMMSPSPFTDPAIIQRQNAMARQAAQQSYQHSDRLQVHEPTASNEAPPVYQGLVSSQYPNLLLPPNALPSIQIVVASSRLRPSRHSMLGLRTQEDSTVFSLAVFSRASRNELWRLEKIPAVLPQLEQQLRPRCKDLPRMPDRKLFSGHSPAIIDARRQAVDAYFEELLDLEMDEASALIICRFLSTDVLDPSTETPKHPGVNHDSLPQNTSLSGKVVKSGFLTKRGKNFGGWKSRFFIIDSPELRYYETPGGPHLGTIRIAQSRIGSQKPEDTSSTDPDDQYRHAFLIQEPKKKDSTSYVRHVLCAESDTDRDEWVKALLHYVEGGDQTEMSSPSLSTTASSTSKQYTSSGRERVVETHSTSPSPTSPTSPMDTSIQDTISGNANISAPMHGAPIQDSTQWGNRTVPQQASKEKSRVPNIFHFKKGSQEQLYQSSKQQEAQSKPRILRHNGYVRAVFGLPLADAVQYCAPFNIDVELPAVVYRSIEYLRFRNAANEEGLFRLSGSNVVVKTLKERFNTEGDIDLVDGEEYYDVHAVASLFKTYLRELPSPLLTRDLHIEFLKVLELDSQEDKVVAFNALVYRLPSVNFHLIRAVSEYLLEVTENAGKNKMSVRNMGIVFSPTVNIPTPVFNLFLSEFDAIFNKNPSDHMNEEPQIRHVEVRAPASLSSDDVRSPRHQMFSELPTPAYHQTSFSTEDSTTNPAARANSHQKSGSGSGEFGFTPLHPSYENGQYVSNPQESRTQAFAPPPAVVTQVEGEEQYGSLDRMLMPTDGRTAKQRKRESMMF